jgi:hypothetical protein
MASDQRHPVRMMMAGEFWHGSTARGLVGGFRALGWDVAEIDILHFVVDRPQPLVARGRARAMAQRDHRI